jgi:hypothetical protein
MAKIRNSVSVRQSTMPFPPEFGGSMVSNSQPQDARNPSVTGNMMSGARTTNVGEAVDG